MSGRRGNGARYLGECWEWFTTAAGAVELRKLHAYIARDGERRFALTEREAALRRKLWGV